MTHQNMATPGPPGPPGPPARHSDFVGTLMKDHRDALVSYAERLLGDHGIAEDIVQEASIRAWRNADRLLGMEGSVRGWLFTVTRHLVVDWVRKPHARNEVVGLTPHERPSRGDGMDAVRDVMVVEPYLRRLSPEHSAVLVHLYLYDRSIRDTAGILGVPTGTVKSRHHHALRNLRAGVGAGAM